MSVKIVAELSASHCGSKEKALELIRAARFIGVDAVKLQTYRPDTITLPSTHPPFLLTSGPWAGRTLWGLYHQAHTPWEWHGDLFAEAKSCGLEVFSSPFDPTAVDFLETLDCPIYKVASFEVCDVPLLERIARTGKPVILSTGVSSYSEIERALRILTPNEVTLLHCVSEYPAPAESMRLRRLADLERHFLCPVGLSDHSLTPTAAIAAIALGATVIEKHLCLDPHDGSPDASFSLTPEQFRMTVQLLREADAAMAPIAPHDLRGPQKSSNATLKKSLWVAKNVVAGEKITPDSVVVRRPGHGLDPARYREVLSGYFTRDIAAATPLSGGDYGLTKAP